MCSSVAVSFIAMCFIWGSTYLFIKVGLLVWPPFLLASLRNLVACAAIILIMVAIRRTLPRSWIEWRNLILFAIFNGSAFALIFWGEQYLPSGQTAILVATVPFFFFVVGSMVDTRGNYSDSIRSSGDWFHWCDIDIRAARG